MHYVHVIIDHIWSMCIVELTVRELRTGHQDSVFGIRIGAGDFYLFRNIQNVSVDHPCTTRIKRPRREANYSLISSNEFNIMSVIIHPRLHLSSSSYRDNFTLGLCTICFELWEADIWGYFSSPYIILLLLSPHINTLLCKLLPTQQHTNWITSGPYVTAILPWTWLQQVTQTPRTDLPKDTRPAI